VRVSGPPDRITCIDCGGICSRLTQPPELGWQPGDLVVYRCRDCRDRWDLIVEDDETDEDGFRT
jgi:hypothetical protein